MNCTEALKICSRAAVEAESKDIMISNPSMAATNELMKHKDVNLIQQQVVFIVAEGSETSLWCRSRKMYLYILKRLRSC